MAEKITSEKEIPANNFKLKVGTFNKNSPLNLYLTGSSYFTPKEKKEDYLNDILSIEKELKSLFCKATQEQGTILAQHVIITDVPTERLKVNKKTHYTFEIHFKPSMSEVFKYKTFGTLVDGLYEQYSHYFPNFIEIIENHGFTCAKTKK